MSDRAPNAWRIEQAMSVAMSAAARIRHETPDIETDEAALLEALTAEGADAEELLRRLFRAAMEAALWAEALDARAAAMHARRDRFKHRVETWRGAALGMMEALGLTKIVDPEFTASIGAPRVGLIITDETAIPASMTRTTTSPDRAAIKAALLAGETVPGAELANGVPVLTIRSK
ncbi:MAG: siphovirus Gp157 family protein [Bradyrhizobium sp.]|nr:siphovirus Gp157 family protein [Bradyrhizobium sp.]